MAARLHGAERLPVMRRASAAGILCAVTACPGCFLAGYGEYARCVGVGAGAVLGSDAPPALPRLDHGTVLELRAGSLWGFEARALLDGDAEAVWLATAHFDFGAFGPFFFNPLAYHRFIRWWIVARLGLGAWSWGESPEAWGFARSVALGVRGGRGELTVGWTKLHDVDGDRDARATTAVAALYW